MSFVNKDLGKQYVAPTILVNYQQLQDVLDASPAGELGIDLGNGFFDKGE